MLNNRLMCALALGLGLALAGCGGGGGSGGGGGGSGSTNPPPAAGPTASKFFIDSFTRPDAAIDASPAETNGALLFKYLTDIPGGSSMGISGNLLALNGANGSPTAIYDRALPTDYVQALLHVSFTGSFVTDGGNMVILRANQSATPTDAFACAAKEGSNTTVSKLAIFAIVSGVSSELASGTADYPMDFGNEYMFRFTAEDPTASGTVALKCELVNRTTGAVLETLTATPSASLANAYGGFRGGDSTGNLRYDNFAIYSYYTELGAALDGTWVGCYLNNAGTVYEKNTYVFSGNTVSISGADHALSDPTCAGTASNAVSGSGTLDYFSTVQAAGWTDRTATAAPPAAVGGGLLPPTPEFTVLTFSGTLGGVSYADEWLDGMYIDNTGTPLKLYFANANPTGSCESSVIWSNHKRCLSTVDVLTKQ